MISLPLTLQIAVAAALLYAAMIVAVIVGQRLDVAIRRGSWRARPPAIDDAYTIWLDAHSRCDRALRAWNRARPAARGAAYLAYIAELEREEEAARRLERLQPAAAE